MPRKKLKRFAEISKFENVLEDPPDIKGCREYFGNDNPITLELACGKGEYTLGLARRYPGRNFIGIDKKGDRIWRGARIALERNMKNVIFLRTDIERIGELFGKKEISEIWITFPDPFPGQRKTAKRLTSPIFLKIYRRILKMNGFIHLKTDDDDLFDYTLHILKSEGCIVHDVTHDLYEKPVSNDLLALKTTYEKKHIEAGRTIKHLCFGFEDHQKNMPENGNLDPGKSAGRAVSFGPTGGKN
jgi:tRNA (guanine-N7-)-methyltransferase